MCLSDLISISNLTAEEKKNLKDGVGYKVFWEKNTNKLAGEYYYTKNYPIRKWINDTKQQNVYLSLDKKYKYQTGFHIFLSFKSAQKWHWRSNDVIRKVKFKDRIALGRQGTRFFYNIVVARQMYILKG